MDLEGTKYALEPDPLLADTDGDGLFDGAEPSPFVDSDGDGSINARDVNSNGDAINDNLQMWVVCRTNSMGGNYVGAGKWIALIAPNANPYTPENYSYTAGMDNSLGYPYKRGRASQFPCQKRL